MGVDTNITSLYLLEADKYPYNTVNDLISDTTKMFVLNVSGLDKVDKMNYRPISDLQFI